MEKAIYLTIRGASQSLWYQRTAHQRRAIVFIVVFSLLLASWIASSDSTAKGATLIYHQMSEPGWSHLVADVPTFHIMAVADNDDKMILSNGKRERASALAEGILHVSTAVAAHSGGHSPTTFRVEWSNVNILKSGYIHDGRGLELSTLQFWNGARLFSCDDHTGIVYEIVLEEGLQPRLVPRHILSDGDGKTPTGMRCEWCTTKGDFLMIGSTGHPWVHEQTGAIVNHNPLWVKTISPLGVVKHIDWTVPYERMRQAMGIGDTGYLIHECGLWSTRWNRWYFIPRHVSNTPYRPGDEHQHGSTAVIVADASFQRIVVNALQGGASPQNPTAGVTDCKFIPNGRDREIIVIKTDETKGASSTQPPKSQKRSGGSPKDPGAAMFQSFISIVNTDGAVLMDDVPMPSGWKFEGMELRPIIHSEH